MNLLYCRTNKNNKKVLNERPDIRDFQGPVSNHIATACKKRDV